jgi:hypothetical protein
MHVADKELNRYLHTYLHACTCKQHTQWRTIFFVYMYVHTQYKQTHTRLTLLQSSGPSSSAAILRSSCILSGGLKSTIGSGLAHMSDWYSPTCDMYPSLYQCVVSMYRNVCMYMCMHAFGMSEEESTVRLSWRLGLVFIHTSMFCTHDRERICLHVCINTHMYAYQWQVTQLQNEMFAAAAQVGHDKLQIHNHTHIDTP